WWAAREPFVGVDSQQPSGRGPQRSVRRSCRRSGKVGLATHFRTAVAAGVDVVEFESAALEVLAEPDVAERAKLFAPLAPCAGNRGADAVEHDLPRHRVEVEAAAGWQEREVVTHLLLDVGARAAEQRAEAPVEPELLPVRTHKVRARAAKGSREERVHRSRRSDEQLAMEALMTGEHHMI